MYSVKVSALLVLLLSWSSSARADKLQDFKEAVAGEGCERIPYADLRSNCKSQQSDVHPLV